MTTAMKPRAIQVFRLMKSIISLYIYKYRAEVLKFSSIQNILYNYIVVNMG